MTFHGAVAKEEAKALLFRHRSFLLLNKSCEGQKHMWDNNRYCGFFYYEWENSNQNSPSLEGSPHTATFYKDREHCHKRHSSKLNFSVSPYPTDFIQYNRMTASRLVVFAAMVVLLGAITLSEGKMEE